jgi:predicted TIM-barrel fold metal-dependent hydrolase
MLVDAHAHIWKADRKYPDPAVTIMSPLCDIPLALFKQYLDEHGVARAVLVQPMYPGEDNSLVADAARAEPDRFAAVAVVDPRIPNAPERLSFWVKEQGCRGLRLRPSFPGEAETFEQEPLWKKSQELGIVVSVLARPEHLPALGRMARRFPEVPVIVDHLAHPDGPAALQALLDLAPLANVRVKPTGFYYYSKTGYPYDDCAGFFKAVYERFGPDRLIWGSDFPHVLLKAGYAGALRLIERRFPYVGPSERERILGGNALALYWRPR